MNESVPAVLSRHHERFIECFLRSAKRHTALAWPTGAGAVGAICALVQRLEPEFRVLAITDRVEIANQFAYRLEHAGLAARTVDRYAYRRLQSELSSSAVRWGGGQVFALTAALASQKDVAAGLQRQAWDLLILIDTPSSFVEKAINTLTSSATRVIWKLRPGSDPSVLDSNTWVVDSVTIGELVRELGLVQTVSPVRVQVHAFEPSSKELAVLSLLEELVVATKGTSAERLATTMPARGMSSVAAIESGLSRLESELQTRWPLWDESAEDAEDEWVPDPKLVGTGDLAAALRLVRACQARLDDLDSDTKLRGLVAHLRRRDPKASVCVFVRYRDTAKYLHAALEDEGIACLLVHGAMSIDDIGFRVRDFLERPGQTLVITTAMLVGMDLRSVRDLVLYDAPATKEVMAQLLGRFHLVGLPALNVVVIADQVTADRTLGMIEEAAKLVV